MTEKIKGGHPPVSPGEPTERIGPFSVGRSMAQWIIAHSGRTGDSQAEIVRQALTSMQRSEERKIRRFERLMQKAKGMGLS